ncbi:uncharacterized protein [Leptinotarsa decemlineata]|uniref:uncharacterized protein n=1 Tax=Leptinotarsa decemlineata TaxID=7539 RepID=UPI003D3055D8
MIKERLGAAERKRLFPSEKRRSRRNIGKKSLIKRKKSTTDNSNNSEESISPFPTRFVQVSGSDDVRPMCSEDISAVASPIEIVETTVNTSQSLYTGVSLQGRRLADIGYLLTQIAEISKHPPFDCTFSDMNS